MPLKKIFFRKGIFPDHSSLCEILCAGMIKLLYNLQYLHLSATVLQEAICILLLCIERQVILTQQQRIQYNDPISAYLEYIVTASTQWVSTEV